MCANESMGPCLTLAHCETLTVTHHARSPTYWPLLSSPLLLPSQGISLSDVVLQAPEVDLTTLEDFKYVAN